EPFERGICCGRSFLLRGFDAAVERMTRKCIRRFLTPLTFAAVAGALLCAGFGCDGSAPSRAAVETPGALPPMVHQTGGGQALQLSAVRIAGMTISEVHRLELPGILDANGQVAFDDRQVSTIVSRVSGRIEQTRVSQWDYVRRGTVIVELFSPDLMTAEAEY